MIHTSVNIAAGATVTIPRSTDLVNSIWNMRGEYYPYNDNNEDSYDAAAWASGSNNKLCVVDMSSSISVKNVSSSYSGTLYYSYAE